MAGKNQSSETQNQTQSSETQNQTQSSETQNQTQPTDAQKSANDKTIQNKEIFKRGEEAGQKQIKKILAEKGLSFDELDTIVSNLSEYKKLTAKEEAQQTEMQKEYQQKLTEQIKEIERIKAESFQKEIDYKKKYKLQSLLGQFSPHNIDEAVNAFSSQFQIDLDENSNLRLQDSEGKPIFDEKHQLLTVDAAAKAWVESESWRFNVQKLSGQNFQNESGLGIDLERIKAGDAAYINSLTPEQLKEIK